MKMIVNFFGFLFLFLSLPSWAEGNSAASFSFQCPTTTKAFVENLGKLEEQVTNWTKTQTHQTEHSALSLIFAPHFLPKNYPLLLGNKACWVGLQDFREKPSKKGYTYWMACLGNMDLKDVPQVKAINDCWLKITKKDKK